MFIHATQSNDKQKWLRDNLDCEFIVKLTLLSTVLSEFPARRLK